MKPINIYRDVKDQDHSKQQRIFKRHYQNYNIQHSAILSLHTTFKGIILKRMFSFWVRIKFIEKSRKNSPQKIMKRSGSRSHRVVEFRTKQSNNTHDINQLKQFNKMIKNSLIQKKLTRSLSPSSHSKTKLLNQIVQKLKRRNKNIDFSEEQDYSFHRRINKLQKMLINIKKQHIITQKKSKVIKHKQKFNDNDFLSDDLDQKVHLEIQKLKLQVNDIKQTQIHLSSDRDNFKQKLSINDRVLISDRKMNNQNSPSYFVKINPPKQNKIFKFVPNKYQCIIPQQTNQIRNSQSRYTCISKGLYFKNPMQYVSVNNISQFIAPQSKIHQSNVNSSKMRSIITNNYSNYSRILPYSYPQKYLQKSLKTSKIFSQRPYVQFTNNLSSSPIHCYSKNIKNPLQKKDSKIR